MTDHHKLLDRLVNLRSAADDEFRAVIKYGESYAPAVPVSDIVRSLRGLIAENESLRALLNWSAGRLLDAGDVEGHEKVLEGLARKA